MESGSQSAGPSERSPNRLADFIGLIIAIVTLTLPLIVIAHYSGSSESMLPPNYSSPPSGGR